jgi:DNA-binding transcriptional ArsR family regulator
VTLTRETYWINDLDTLRVVVDPLRLQILDALTDEPLNVKQIAEKLGAKPTRLYYHVNALEDAGLVQVVETRMKKNMVERYYLAVARDFRVDSGLLQTRTEGPSGADPAVLSAVLQATSNDVELAVNSGMLSAADLDTQTSSRTLFNRDAYRFRSSQIPHLIDRLNLLLAEFSQAEVVHGEETYVLTIAFFPRVNNEGE